MKSDFIATPIAEVVDADDLVDDPRTDIEALCLGAVLRSAPADARRITRMLTAADFARPTYAELFVVIGAHVISAGIPHDPASIGAALSEAGKPAERCTAGTAGQLRRSWR